MRKPGRKGRRLRDYFDLLPVAAALLILLVGMTIIATHWR